MNAPEVFDKFFERLLKPETLLAIATLIGVLRTWKQGKDAKKEIIKNTLLTTENTKGIQDVHVLVNDLSTRGLGREAAQADRIAGLTQDPGDQRTADRQREDYDTKKAADAKVSKENEKG